MAFPGEDPPLPWSWTATLWTGKRHLWMKMGNMTDALEIFNESYVSLKRIRRYDEVIYPLGNMAQIHFIMGVLRRVIDGLKDR